MSEEDETFDEQFYPTGRNPHEGEWICSHCGTVNRPRSLGQGAELQGCSRCGGHKAVEKKERIE